MNKIKEFRERLGLTQQQLADKLDVTRECVSNYELYKREPDSMIFARLKEKFNVNDQMIGEMLLDYAEKKKACGINQNRN